MTDSDRIVQQPLFVLAGGFGTRLRSAVGSVPKPLAPVGDQPFLLYLLENWIAQGVRRFVFALGHQASTIEHFLQDERSRRVLEFCDVSTIIEPVPLGTGGSIANALNHTGVNAAFLVANADTWLGSGIVDVAAMSAPGLAVIRVEDTGRYGAVNLSGSKVVSFEEKQQIGGAGWVNAGLYHLHADLFKSWDAKSFSLESALLPVWAASGLLSAVAVDETFIDIGVPDDYFRFRRWIESGKRNSL
jgi:D-glycero-alpha-D-manno-heptose 1-phosphate guanylyltransferase